MKMCVYGCLSTGNWHQFNVHLYFAWAFVELRGWKYTLTLHRKAQHPLDLSLFVSYFISRSVISCNSKKNAPTRPGIENVLMRFKQRRVFGVMIIIINV